MPSPPTIPPPLEQDNMPLAPIQFLPSPQTSILYQPNMRNTTSISCFLCLRPSIQTSKTHSVFWAVDYHSSATRQRQETCLYGQLLVFGGSSWPSLGLKTENVPSLACFLGSGMSLPATKLEKCDTLSSSFMFGGFFPLFR